jgi:hypothetical protein
MADPVQLRSMLGSRRRENRSGNGKGEDDNDLQERLHPGHLLKPEAQYGAEDRSSATGPHRLILIWWPGR